MRSGSSERSRAVRATCRREIATASRSSTCQRGRRSAASNDLVGNATAEAGETLHLLRGCRPNTRSNRAEALRWFRPRAGSRSCLSETSWHVAGHRDRTVGARRREGVASRRRILDAVRTSPGRPPEQQPRVVFVDRTREGCSSERAGWPEPTVAPPFDGYHAGNAVSAGRAPGRTWPASDRRAGRCASEPEDAGIDCLVRDWTALTGDLIPRGGAPARQRRQSQPSAIRRNGCAMRLRSRTAADAIRWRTHAASGTRWKISDGRRCAHAGRLRSRRVSRLARPVRGLMTSVHARRLAAADGRTGRPRPVSLGARRLPRAGCRRRGATASTWPSSSIS
jgi:hypothetical protein